MALAASLYRFRIQLSDLDRGVYQALDFRVAAHASETGPYFLSRVLAYALNVEEGLEFSAGLSATDDPALQLKDAGGTILKSIEIGQPSYARLQKIAKASRIVRVYTYKDPQNLKLEIKGRPFHRGAVIELFSFDRSFLEPLEKLLERDNHWSLTHSENAVVVYAKDQELQGEVPLHSLEL